MATKRELQKAQTRGKLLQAALLEFGRRGIMASRISDIADAAGVSHGTIFVHFESQEALIIAAIEEFGKTTTLRTHELASDCAGIREVLAAHLAGLEEFETFYTRLVIEARLLPPAARHTLIAVQSAVSFHISAAAQRDMDAGRILSMPIPLLFNTWIGLVDYYLVNGDLFAPNGSVLERYGPALLDHFVNLISAR